MLVVFVLAETNPIFLADYAAIKQFGCHPTLSKSIFLMLEIVKNDIFPIFSVLLLGFCLGKYKIISREEASTLNKIGFLVFQPALIFTLILNTNIAGILFQALGLYALAQIVLFCSLY